MKDFEAAGENELAPDVDWLLSGGQASAEVLSAALTKEFFTPLCRLALCLLDEQKGAAVAALEALIAAQSRVYSFTGQISSRAWVFRQALPVFSRALRAARWRRGLRAFISRSSSSDGETGALPSSEAEAELWLSVDALPLKLKLPYLLLHVLEWGVEEIGLLLKVEPDEVRSRLRQASKYIQTRLDDQEALPASFESLKKRWPAPDFDVGELQEIAAEIARQAARRGKGGKRRNAAGEIVTLLLTLSVVGLLILNADKLGLEVDPSPGPASQPRVQRTRGPAPTPPLEYSYYLLPGDTLENISQKLGFSVENLAAWNDLNPSQPLPASGELRLYYDTYPWTDLPGGEVRPVAHRMSPLNENSSQEEVRAFLRSDDALWKTVWLDVQLTYYGPPGYIGWAPFIYRSRTWADNSGWRMELNGDARKNEIDHLVLASNGLTYWMDLNDLKYSMDTGQVTVIPAGQRGISWSSIELSDPTRSDLFNFDSERFEIIGRDMVAGRETLVVEWMPSSGTLGSLLPALSRLWIDTITGVALRYQTYSGPEMQTLIAEMIANRVEYDIKIPFKPVGDPRLLNLSQLSSGLEGSLAAARTPGGAETSQGLRQASRQAFLPRLRAPEGFDPAGSWLSFQFAPESGQNPFARNPEVVVELFADRYFLAELPNFPAVDRVSCGRSRDGRRIAYFGQLPDGTEVISWLDLSLPGEAQSFRSDFSGPRSLAFSPDGKHIVATGRVSGTHRYALFQYDLPEGTGTEIRELEGYADSLVVSPSGKSVALILWPEDNQDLLVHVVDIASGEIVYTNPIDRDSINPTRQMENWLVENFPEKDWNGDFHSHPNSLIACAAP